MAQGHYIEISLFFVSLRNGLFKLRSKRIRSLPLNPLRRASVIFCIPSAAVPVNSTLWLVIIPIVSPSQVLIDQLPTVATDSSGGQGHFKALQGHQLRLPDSGSQKLKFEFKLHYLEIFIFKRESHIVCWWAKIIRSQHAFTEKIFGWFSVNVWKVFERHFSWKYFLMTFQMVTLMLVADHL